MSLQPSTVAPGVLLVVKEPNDLSSIDTTDLPDGTLAYVRDDALNGQQNATPYFTLVKLSGVTVPSANTIPTRDAYNALGALVGTNRWRRNSIAFLAP